MKSLSKYRLIFLLTIVSVNLLIGCNTKSENESSAHLIDNVIHTSDETLSESSRDFSSVEQWPKTCVDWIGYYGKSTRELDSLVDKKSYKVKSEGYDEYSSPNRLEGTYVLKDENMPIERIGDLGKYLAYMLCLSDKKNLNGVLMDCEKRKIQVVIARTEKKYNDQAWAVVYNVFPANKKGDLIILDYKY